MKLNVLDRAHFCLKCSNNSYVVNCRETVVLQGGDSQNFLRKFERVFLTFGLKILRLFNFKVLFEADIIKG